MDVLVVGGGIGGLATALGLRHQGHKVTIFEQSRQATESGAAIFLTPNANGPLRAWGFNAEEWGAVAYKGHTNHSSTGGIISSERVNATDFDHRWDLLRRSMLHAGLKYLATDPSRPGVPVKLQTASRVVSVDADRASVRLQDGTDWHGDVIIGADGTHSVARNELCHIPTGTSIVPFSSGKNAFRFLLPRETLLAHEVTKKVYGDGAEGLLIAWYGPHSRLISYPCEDNKVINFAAIHPSSMSDVQRDSYNAVGNKNSLLAAFAGFEPAVKKIMELVEPANLKVYPLLDMDFLPTYRRNRLALIGDAAHPFLPYQGQGGAQAIEDAVSIAAMLPANTDPKDVSARLALYDKARRGRVEEVQRMTRILGQDAIPPSQLPDFLKLREYNFQHDEWKCSSALLQKHLRAESARM